MAISTPSHSPTIASCRPLPRRHPRAAILATGSARLNYLAGKACGWTSRHDARHDFFGEQAETVAAERRAHQVVEADLFLEARDLVDQRLGRAVQDDAVAIVL